MCFDSDNTCGGVSILPIWQDGIGTWRQPERTEATKTGARNRRHNGENSSGATLDGYVQMLYIARPTGLESPCRRGSELSIYHQLRMTSRPYLTGKVLPIESQAPNKSIVICPSPQVSDIKQRGTCLKRLSCKTPLDYDTFGSEVFFSAMASERRPTVQELCQEYIMHLTCGPGQPLTRHI